MTRISLLAAGALFALAVPALADGPSPRLTGLGDVGFDYVDLDNGNFSQFHATGSALWALPDKWNIQGNFDVNTFNGDADGISNTKFGVGAFWRDLSEGLLGGELRYQTVGGVDGFDIRARGEAYLQNITLGGFLGYGGYDDIDGWHLGAYGTYYVDPRFGISLTAKQSNWDGDGSTSDFDDWSLSGEAEYLFPEYDTSVYGGLGFGSLDPDTGADADYWHIGVGLRVHLGTDGSLQQRNKSEPLRTVRDHYIF